MKTLKLITLGLVIFCFCFSTNASAQADVWRFDHPHQIDEPCLGEVIQGQMYMHFVRNGKFVIANLSGEYIGTETGKVYHVLGNWKWQFGTPFPTNISIRIRGENGLAFMLHAVFKNDRLSINGCM